MPTIVGSGVTIKEDPKVGKVVTYHSKTIEAPGGGSLEIRCVNGELKISGNPSHWDQPHNLFGKDLEQSKAIYQEIAEKYTDRQFDRSAVITRIDVCRNLSAGSPMALRKFMQVMKQKKYPRLTRNIWDTAVEHSSKERKLRIYEKGPEYLEKNERPDLEIYNWCKETGFVRIEWQLRRYLYRKAMRHWAIANNQMAEHYYEKLTRQIMPKEEEIKIEEVLQELPGQTRLVFAAWRAGEDLNQILKKSAWYHHRRLIKKKIGIDIASDVVKPMAALRAYEKPVVLTEIEKPEIA